MSKLLCIHITWFLRFDFRGVNFDFSKLNFIVGYDLLKEEKYVFKTYENLLVLLYFNINSKKFK